MIDKAYIANDDWLCQRLQQSSWEAEMQEQGHGRLAACCLSGSID